MTEEKTIIETGTDAVDNTDYIAAIKELKQNSVDRSKYDALRAENKKLLDSIVNGTEIAQPVVEQKKSIGELRDAYLKEDQSNLEYITNTLKLREAIIAEGKPAPFLPIGEQIMPTDEDIKTACCVTLYYDNTDKPGKLYSYNQLIDGEYVHAEEVVLNYIESLGIDKIRTIYSMLEPCYDCLQKTISFMPQYIIYFKNHKAKWDTFNYIQLSNDLFAGRYLSEVSNMTDKMHYDKLHDKLIEKFYKEK